MQFSVGRRFRDGFALLKVGVLLATLFFGRDACATEIAVDVGHTLTASRAVSARGGKEFDFNRGFAERLVQALEAKNLSVRGINFDGRIESLDARPRQAVGSDLFISIHHDFVQAKFLEQWVWAEKAETFSDRHRGFSLFVSHNNPDLRTSLLCASTIGARLRRLGFVGASHHVDSIEGQARPFADADNFVYYYDNLVVLYRTTLPAVLFEAGVIKHREEELTLRDPGLQARMAHGIATGVAACLYVKTNIEYR